MKVFKCAALTAVVVANNATAPVLGRQNFEGDVVLEAVPKTAAQVEQVRELEERYQLDFWFPPDARRIQANEHFQVRVVAEEKYDIIRELLDTNMVFRILHNNLDQMVAESIHKTQVDVQFSASSMGNGFVDRTDDIHNYDYFVYHTQPEIDNWANQMADTFDQIVTKVNYGKSYENRDLYALVIKEQQGRDNVPKVMIDCGVHAREWISHSVCQYFVGQLVNPNSPFAALRDGVEWHVIPNVNPDGYAFSWTKGGRFWRKNRNPNTDPATQAAQRENGANNAMCGISRGVGVDLNRNYDIMWTNKNMVGADKWCSSDSYRGASAFSEPESRAHADYILDHSFQAYLTMHSYAEVLLFPYTFSSRAPRPHNYAELMDLGGEIVKRIGGHWRFGQGRDIFYPAAGGSDDWAHMKAQIPISYTFELRDSGIYGFMLPERMIQKSVEEATRGVSAVRDHLIKKFNVEVSSTDSAASSAEAVASLKTHCDVNPEDFYGSGDYECSMKTGKCKMTCEKGGTPSHKFVKCKKVPRSSQFGWSPKSAKAVKCMPAINIEDAPAHFAAGLERLDLELDEERMSAFKMVNCKVIKKKLDCSIQCNSAVNCGKKCSMKAPMVRAKSGDMNLKKTVAVKALALIDKC